MAPRLLLAERSRLICVTSKGQDDHQFEPEGSRAELSLQTTVDWNGGTRYVLGSITGEK